MKEKDIYEKDKKLLPPEYRADNIIEQYKYERNIEQLQTRLICDYVSGMMDSYAINRYEELTGIPFDKIVI